MRQGLFLLVAFVVSFATLSYAASPEYTFPAEGRFIMALDKSADVLKQCRKVPQNITEFWTPTEEDIRELEDALEPFLAEFAKTARYFPRPDAYYRQYIGIVKDDKRLIYGSFFPVSDVKRTEKSHAAYGIH